MIEQPGTQPSPTPADGGTPSKPRKIRKGLLTEQQLLNASGILATAMTDPFITAGFDRYKFNASRLAEGKALIDDLVSRAARQRQEAGDQHQTTQEINETWGELRRTLSDYLRLAKLAFPKDLAQREALGIGKQSEKKTISGWVQFARAFYATALDDPAILAGFDRYGVSRDELAVARQAVEDLVALHGRGGVDRGEAQGATRAKDEKRQAFLAWLREFRTIAKVAFRQHPEVLTKLAM